MELPNEAFFFLLAIIAMIIVKLETYYFIKIMQPVSQTMIEKMESNRQILLKKI